MLSTQLPAKQNREVAKRVSDLLYTPVFFSASLPLRQEHESHACTNQSLCQRAMPCCASFSRPLWTECNLEIHQNLLGQFDPKSIVDPKPSNNMRNSGMTPISSVAGTLTTTWRGAWCLCLDALALTALALRAFFLGRSSSGS